MLFLEIGFQLSEFFAMVVGLYYLKNRSLDRMTRYFVYFLCFTFTVEMVGNIAKLIFYYPEFSFLKNTLLAKNHWLYNSYSVISFSFYVLFFESYLKNKTNKTILTSLNILLVLSSIFYYIFIGSFFDSYYSFNMLFGAFLILLSVFFYFYEVLQSEKNIQFNTDFVFYIGVGSSVFHLCITPLFIYSTYFNTANPFFLEMHNVIVRSLIILMYICFAFGFWVCFSKKKSY